MKLHYVKGETIERNTDNNIHKCSQIPKEKFCCQKLASTNFNYQYSRDSQRQKEVFPVEFQTPTENFLQLMRLVVNFLLLNYLLHFQDNFLITAAPFLISFTQVITIFIILTNKIS
jgi:hypothetical protein